MSTATGHTRAICAGRVMGTAVKDANGNKIGEIEDVVLDKLSNNIMFAAVSFGGFLGMGEKYHAVPWPELDYDEDEGSYVVNFTREQLHAAPADSLEVLTSNDGLDFRNTSYGYYKTKPYW
jgi:sporulation protein YlmC with PRC-barrel domain